MSFFWNTTSYTPKKAQPVEPVVSSPPVIDLTHDSTIEVKCEPTSTPPIVSSNVHRSVPTADAFKPVCVERRRREPLVVDTSSPQPPQSCDTTLNCYRISDECTPQHSTYNSPRYDVQFVYEAPDVYTNLESIDVWSEPCTPTYNTKLPRFDFMERVHTLENAFHNTNSNFVNHGVYKNQVLHGGFARPALPPRRMHKKSKTPNPNYDSKYTFVSEPDRDDLCQHSDYMLNTDTRFYDPPSSYPLNHRNNHKLSDITNKLSFLLQSTYSLHEQLNKLANEMADLSIDLK